VSIFFHPIERIAPRTDGHPRIQDPTSIFADFMSSMGGFGMGGGAGPRAFDFMDVDDQPGSPFGGHTASGASPFGTSPFGTGRASGYRDTRKRANSFGASGTRARSASNAAPTTDSNASSSATPSEIVKPLKLSLEELFKGVTKKLKMTRKLLDGTEEEKVVEINASPLNSPWGFDNSLMSTVRINRQNQVGKRVLESNFPVQATSVKTGHPPTSYFSLKRNPIPDSSVLETIWKRPSRSR
jgi:hypothetical protein